MFENSHATTKRADKTKERKGGKKAKGKQDTCCVKAKGKQDTCCVKAKGKQDT